MEQITTTIISLTAFVTAIATLIANLIKAKKEIKDSIPKKVKKQNPINIQINDKLEEAKEFFQAERVQIYHFHNGVKTASNISYLKISCVYEVVRYGAKGYQFELQNIPISCIPKFIDRLLEDKLMVVNDLEDIKDDMPAAYQLKFNEGIKSFVDVILNDKNGEPIGFLAFQYSKKNAIKMIEKNEDELMRLKYWLEEIFEKLK